MKEPTVAPVVVQPKDVMLIFSVQVIEGRLSMEMGPGQYLPIPVNEVFQMGVGLGRGWLGIRVTGKDN